MSSIVRFIGCLHLGHENMATNRGFSSADEYHTLLIEKWNSVVSKRDITYILGDVTMEKALHYPLLDKLNGIKKVILGNHDMPTHVPNLLEHVNTVSGMFKYKRAILTHCPIHPMEMGRFQYNIHAHIHAEIVPNNEDGKYLHTDAKLLEYTPRTLEELIIINKNMKHHLKDNDWNSLHTKIAWIEALDPNLFEERLKEYPGKTRFVVNIELDWCCINLETKLGSHEIVSSRGATKKLAVEHALDVFKTYYKYLNYED